MFSFHLCFIFVNFKTGKETSKAVTMAGKLKDPKPMDIPAPGTYQPEKASKILDTQPAYTFGLKTEQKIHSISPAPGTYDVAKAEKILDSHPAFTFGLRPELKIYSISPAPNAYRPEDC